MSLGFLTRSDTNQAVQPQKRARGLKFLDLGSRGIVLSMYGKYSENKGDDQLCGYRAFVFVYAKNRFSHDAAHIQYSTWHFLFEY